MHSRIQPIWVLDRYDLAVGVPANQPERKAQLMLSVAVPAKQFTPFVQCVNITTMTSQHQLGVGTGTMPVDSTPTDECSIGL